MTLSVVLPCYNEAKSLDRLIEDYRSGANRKGLLPDRFELILVNNGSTDESAQILNLYVKRQSYNFIKVVTIDRNEGYGHGLLAGLKEARFGTCAFSHADEQCAAADVFRAFDLLAGNDGVLVKGHRKGRKLSDRLFSRSFEFCVWLCLHKRIIEINAQPKVFPAWLLKEVQRQAPKDFAFDLHVLLRALEHDMEIREIPVTFHSRAHGQSRWSSTVSSKIRHIKLMLNYLRGSRQFFRTLSG